MNTFLALLFFVALIATGYHTVRWLIDKIQHHPRHHGRNALISLGATVVLMIGVVATTPSTNLTPTQAAAQIKSAVHTQHTLTARVAKADSTAEKLAQQKALLKAQVKQAKLAATKAADQRDATSSSLAKAASQKAAAASVAAANSAKIKAQQAAAASSQAAAASKAQAQAAAAANSRTKAQAAATGGNHAAPVNNGDMNTGNAQKIVGNVNSKIYHVPGQAGYKMNSANARYFDTEQQAIAAGYRKSKR